MTEPSAESLARAQSCFSLICEQDIPIDAFEVRHIARAIDEAVDSSRADCPFAECDRKGERVDEAVAAERKRAQDIIEAIIPIRTAYEVSNLRKTEAQPLDGYWSTYEAAVRRWEEGAK